MCIKVIKILLVVMFYRTSTAFKIATILSDKYVRKVEVNVKSSHLELKDRFE